MLRGETYSHAAQCIVTVAFTDLFLGTVQAAVLILQTWDSDLQTNTSYVMLYGHVHILEIYI